MSTVPDIEVSDFIAAAKMVEDCGWKIIRPGPDRVSIATGATGKTSRFFVQDWDCDLSPIGKCIGDGDDPEGCCVFCRDPEERK
jgi:hypothetical protein